MTVRRPPPKASIVQTVHTSVIARRVRIDTDFATLPYEAGWATEAVFFTQVEGQHPPLTVTAEISPDGINWLPHGEPQVLDEDASMVATPLSVFGNWVRVTIRGATEASAARVLVHLTLKG
jgi:hypothetical protein